MEKEPKYKKIVSGAYDLSLGISMVVAVLIGIALGIGMKKLTGYSWLFWLGVFWGVSAAILNIYKAYKRQQKEYKELENDIRYTYHKNKDDEENS